MPTGKAKLLHDSRFDDATPAASSTAAGEFNVLNVRDWRPYTWWKAAAMPATITVDCGSARSADYFVLWGHDLGSVGATVQCRGSTDNFVGSDVLVASSTPANDLPLLVAFGAVSYRYWRLRFTGATAPQVAIAAIGAALALPRRLALGFDPLARAAAGQSTRSEGGHPLGASVVFEEWSAQIAVRNVSWSWLRSTFLPAWKGHLRAAPFVLAWDPDEHATELLLLQSSGMLSTPHNRGELADLAFDARGLALA